MPEFGILSGLFGAEYSLKRYHAFGLSIEADLDFPELLKVDSDGSGPDLVITQSAGISPFQTPVADHQPQPDKLQFRLKIINAGDFLIENGNRITYQPADGVSEGELRLFLLGSCLGCVLQQRGLVVLHGNAVTTDGETCKIIVGHQGAGKSTYAAWYYQQGAKILADDVCALSWDAQGRPQVIPSYPQLKLWQATADLLGIRTQGLRRVRPQDEKFALPITDQFWRSPLPLTEVIELSSTSTTVAPIVGMYKARCLIEHSYRYNFLENMGLTRAYMKTVLRLTSLVTMKTGGRMALNGPGI